MTSSTDVVGIVVIHCSFASIEFFVIRLLVFPAAVLERITADHFFLYINGKRCCLAVLPALAKTPQKDVVVLAVDPVTQSVPVQSKEQTEGIYQIKATLLQIHCMVCTPAKTRRTDHTYTRLGNSVLVRPAEQGCKVAYKVTT